MADLVGGWNWMVKLHGNETWVTNPVVPLCSDPLA
jgi:hypothetical protein